MAVPLTILEKKYFYGEGEDLLFDDLARHHVRNEGPLRRVSLIIDIKRDFGHFFVDLLNSVILRAVEWNPTVLHIVENTETMCIDKT